MSSLRSRLGLGLLISLIVMIGLLLLISHTSIHSLMEGQVASRLAHDGETLLGGLNIHNDGKVSLDVHRVQGIYHQPFSGHYFIIDVEGTSIRSRSLWDETLEVPQVDAGETRLSYITGPQQQPLLLWTRSYRKQDKVIRLAVAEDLAPMQAGKQRIRIRLLSWSLAVVFVLLLIQQYIVLRTLRPVSAAADDVSRLEAGEINAISEQVPDEVKPMVRAINKLLQRQQQRLQRSREAMGNLAHSIKTPLTLLQQLAGEKTGEIDNTTREQCKMNIQRINELVDISLRRARLAGDSLGAGRFDLNNDLPVLIDTIERLHKDKPIQFHQELDNIRQLPLEQQDGMELLGNLLDNAWKWAHSTVKLTIKNGTPLLINIEDDGEGVDEASMRELMQRGKRQDENTPGHGIGLSIVKGLVEELGGHVDLSASPTLGGLKVSVELDHPSGHGAT